MGKRDWTSTSSQIPEPLLEALSPASEVEPGVTISTFYPWPHTGNLGPCFRTRVGSTHTGVEEVIKIKLPHMGTVGGGKGRGFILTVPIRG